MESKTIKKNEKMEKSELSKRFFLFYIIFLLAFCSFVPKVVAQTVTPQDTTIEEYDYLEDLTGVPAYDSTNYVAPQPILRNAILRANSAATSFIISITHYKQYNYTDAYGSGSCGSIKSTGCALTCVSMVLSAHGVSDAQPNNLNAWGQNNGGYSGCDILGSKLCTYHCSNNPVTYATYSLYSLSVIKSQIDAGNPVGVHVTNSKGVACHHYVLVYGYNNLGTTKSDFLVSDPGTSASGRTLNDYTICTSDALRLYGNVRSTSNLTPAGTPTISFSPTNYIFENNLTVSWKSVSGANSYTLKIKQLAGEQNPGENETSYPLKNPVNIYDNDGQVINYNLGNVTSYTLTPSTYSELSRLYVGKYVKIYVQANLSNGNTTSAYDYFLIKPKQPTLTNVPSFVTAGKNLDLSWQSTNAPEVKYSYAVKELYNGIPDENSPDEYLEDEPGISRGSQSNMTNNNVTISLPPYMQSGRYFKIWISANANYAGSAATYYIPINAATYTVTFDRQSGAGGSSSVTATYGSAMPSATAPTRTGYTFGGYYTGTNGTGTQYYNASMGSARNWDITSNTTLYAKWTPTTVTPDLQLVSIVVNGTLYQNQQGSFTATVKNNGNGAYNSHLFIYMEKPNIYTPNQRIDGSIISIAAGETKTITIAGTVTLPPDTYSLNMVYDANNNPSNMTTYQFNGIPGLQAIVKAQIYTITFDAQSGTVSPTSQTVTYGSTVGTLPTPTRTGYTFGGWFTGTNGSGTQYTSSIVYNTVGNITLYAKWTPNTYTVTLDRQNGAGGSASITATYDAAMPSAMAPTRTGYTFGGYYTGTNGTGTQYYNVSMGSARNWNIASATTLYAQWTVNAVTTYAISTLSNPAVGGATSGDGTYSSGASCTVNATANSGYSFSNWTENGSVISTSSCYTFTVSSNRSLVANFTQNTYNITPSAGSGGSISPSTVQTVTYGGSKTFTATPNSCQDVDQWKVDGSVVQTGGTSYTISNVQANATVSVTFKTRIFAVTASAGSGGIISPNGIMNVSCGNSQTYYFYPNADYEIDQVLINGSVNATAKAYGYYTFSNVTDNQTISVTFKQQITCKTPPAEYDETLPTPTTSWQTWSGSIQSGGCYVYRISVTSGQKYTFKTGCGNGATANFDTELYLYNNSGSQLTSNDDGCELNRSKVEDYQFNYTGYAYVLVKGYGSNSGSYTLAYAVTGGTGINEVENAKLQIYPNPVKDEIFIKSELPITKIEISSLTGTLLILENNFNERISVSTLPKGIYLLKVYTDKGVIISKIVKE